jgi:hypothetical protein
MHHALLVRVVGFAVAFSPVATAAAHSSGSGGGFTRKSDAVHSQQARIHRVPELRERAHCRAQIVESERLRLHEPHAHPGVGSPEYAVGAALAEDAHVPSRA